MKKWLSFILLICTAISTTCFGCSAITPSQASLNQLLDTAVKTDNEELKQQVMDEIAKRDDNVIIAKVSDNFYEIQLLNQKLVTLKNNPTTLYDDVKKVELKLNSAIKVNKVLQDELQRRVPWYKYLAKKFIDTAGATVNGGLCGLLSGAVATVILAPFSGFNAELIRHYTANTAISSAITTALSDVRRKLGSLNGFIFDMASNIISFKLTSKLLSKG